MPKLNKKNTSLELLFNIFKKEGRELGAIEIKQLYPDETRLITKSWDNTNIKRVIRKARQVLAYKWDEIEAAAVKIAPPPPPPPVVEEEIEEVADPLEALRSASQEEEDE